MAKHFVCASPHCQLPVALQSDRIIIHDAREHNLKNICFAIPKKKLVALTGLSGSGKSSIAFGILGQECVRQYLESLGMTTDHVPKAKVGTILGLSPSICISQRATDFNPRSTVGTKTGILTILRNMFAAMGYQLCERCGNKVKQPLQDAHKLTTVIVEEKLKTSFNTKQIEKNYFSCSHCGELLEKLKMEHFSLNALAGSCAVCKGAGEVVSVDIAQLFDETKSLAQGGVKAWDAAIAKYKQTIILAASRHYQFPFDPNSPIGSYTQLQKNFLLYGIQCPVFAKQHVGIKPPKKVGDGNYEGLIPYLMELYKTDPDKTSAYIIQQPCSACENTGLGKLGRTVTVGSNTIVEVSNLSLSEFINWVQMLEQRVATDELAVLAAFSNALEERTANLIEVGLDYLTLNRTLPSLSGGESQRLKLAAALSSGLTGVLYILDEPTTGLHPHDTAKLLSTLHKLKAADNTVLVIEHDLDVIKQMDYIIDMGPGRGTQGGEVVIAGTPAEVIACKHSVTGQHLAKASEITFEPQLRRCDKAIKIYGAAEHNLKNIDVSIPLNHFVVMTGISGSGKSTLVFDVLDKAARKQLNHAREIPGKHALIEGLEYIERVVTVDQTTLGKTKSSRSNVATYTKLFDWIRDLFAALPEAKTKNFTANSFSFNASDERCDNCNGAGTIEIDLAFMPEVEMECPACNGMRFTENLLSIKLQGFNIAEILTMTVSDALLFFVGRKKIYELLKLMARVGLEHLTLGQSTATLSGGEAQRIKLAAELAKSNRENTLYLLDEPTTGLHTQEIGMLLTILKELVAKRNTVVVIEHHLNVIAQADTIIDFGPGAGMSGGRVVATGTPHEVAANSDSLTGQYLQAYLYPFHKRLRYDLLSDTKRYSHRLNETI